MILIHTTEESKTIQSLQFLQAIVTDLNSKELFLKSECREFKHNLLFEDTIKD